MIDNLQAMIAALRGEPPQAPVAPPPRVPFDNNTMEPGMNSFAPMPSDFVHRVGDYIGQVPVGTPQEKDWNDTWQQAMPVPKDPNAFMKARPPGEEGATFSDYPTILWLRQKQKKDDGPPMS